jgi:hypothetical protein
LPDSSAVRTIARRVAEIVEAEHRQRFGVAGDEQPGVPGQLLADADLVVGERRQGIVRVAPTLPDRPDGGR